MNFGIQPAATNDDDISVLAYPSLSEAAEMIGVSPSTLSRRRPRFELAGGRDKRLRPGVVLENAAYDRRRPLRNVATELIAYAHSHAPEAEQVVRIEVENALAALRIPNGLTVQELLQDLRRELPAQLYERVERVFKLDELPRIPAMISPRARAEIGT